MTMSTFIETLRRAAIGNGNKFVAFSGSNDETGEAHAIHKMGLLPIFATDGRPFVLLECKSLPVTLNEEDGDYLNEG